MKKLFKFLGHQKWIRFGLRDRLIRMYHNPDKAISENFRVSFFNKVYIGNFNTFLDWSVYYYGAYAEEELLLMHDSIKGKNSIVVDIGANVGHHTLFASTIADKVHCFEPYSEVCKKIREKQKLNNLHNIQIHEIGLGNINALLEFHPPAGCNTGTGSFLGSNQTDNIVIKLPVRIGDEYFNEHAIKKVDYIKIDVEGFEEYVLKGLQKTINDYRPVIFFEWSSNQRGKKYNYKDLFPDNYQFYDFISSKHFLLFLQIFGYQLKKTDLSNIKDGNKVAIPDEKTQHYLKHIIR
jgi:FkbM family methyltransferase